MESQENSSSVLYTLNFGDVQKAESRRINEYRAHNRRESLLNVDNLPPKGAIDLSGLALSGGGIRSAAFCLGVLQALESEVGIEKIDYLSTVSGGGYIGLSLSAGMNKTGDSQGNYRFPFMTNKDEKGDNPVVGHIRNHSRYLIPNGMKDLLSSLTVVLRGLSANISIVSAAILLAAAITLIANSNLLSFGANPDTATTLNQITASLGNFAWTKLCLLVALVFQVLWAFAKSQQGEGKPEFKGLGYNFLRYWLQITAIVAFCELQPFILDALKSTYGPSNIPVWIDKLAKFATQITPYMASLAALVAFASKYFGDEIKVQAGKKGFASTFKWLLSKSVLVIAALALPIVIWGIYLRTTLWGYTRYQDWPHWLTQPINDFCYQLKPEPWGNFCTSVKEAPLYTIATVFLVAGGGILLLSWKFLTPNTNSLHRLYRDRLSEAFLVDPTEVSQQRMNDADAEDASSLDTIKLSSLAANFAPVHLSNAALNIQGSEFANKRGRNADFFFFSQAYSGSRATGFIKTSELEKTVPELDVATIMAISGAAASSNMGSNTVWGFAPTLALLNIRLGFWMRNPNSIIPKEGNATFKSKTLGTLYLIKEMFSKLSETDDAIYLTDGGHIENLGLYELLRRRCKHIIVVDAEADPSMSFRSLVDVERYARIDLGIRIDLPWQTIRNSSLEIDDIFSKGKRPTAKQRAKHPHVSIGTVDYGSGAKGILVYIKSSLTGDENDYILDYKARYSAFPHETTSDQFFSEEQFEVYRALGFHAAHGAFNGKSYVAGKQNLPAAGRTKAKAKPVTLKSLFT